jgi:hypothetical protein
MTHRHASHGVPSTLVRCFPEPAIWLGRSSCSADHRGCSAISKTCALLARRPFLAASCHCCRFSNLLGTHIGVYFDGGAAALYIQWMVTVNVPVLDYGQNDLLLCVLLITIHSLAADNAAAAAVLVVLVVRLSR